MEETDTQTISQLFFDIMKRETKALFQPVDNDELRIEVAHRLI
ncbi:MAG: hypothetical protein AABX82_08265 [Nanoarchaeota archaeon]